MKKIRIVDEELLATVRTIPCLACASADPQGAMDAMRMEETRAHPHHVISRGAGGDDVPENLLPLCHNHHVEIHMLGNRRMAEKYRVVYDWLVNAGHLEPGHGHDRLR